MRVTTFRHVLARFGDASRYRHAAAHHLDWGRCLDATCKADRELIEQGEKELRREKTR